MLNKEVLLNTLHKFPGISKIESDLFFNKTPYRGFRIKLLEDGSLLKEWNETIEHCEIEKSSAVKKILIFATTSFWIEYAAALAYVYRALGHEVEFLYLPENRKYDHVAEFESARYDAYANRVLAPMGKHILLTNYHDLPVSEATLPEKLVDEAEKIAKWDVQYTLQFEDVDLDGELYQWRLARNLDAVKRFLPYLEDNRPDVVVIPNGLILEFGMLKQVCDVLKIPTTTYEFGEQRERMWISHHESIMLMKTDAMWEKVKDELFMDAQKEKIEQLYVARRGADVFEQFARRWQSQPMQDEDKLREGLGLDERPIGLMATNVFGDSLTLGRDIFTGGIQGWLEGTLDYFAETPELQLIVRVHPGELLNPEGYSVGDSVKSYFPDGIPENIHLIEAADKTNTYSLINLASFGLTYTTTVGMELAMSGVPVVVVGETHYRGKGFTFDPRSWEDYRAMLDEFKNLDVPVKMSEKQIDDAWHYAYGFFFEYPHVFPWHLIKFAQDLEERPMKMVLKPEVMKDYRNTFDTIVFE